MGSESMIEIEVLENKIFFRDGMRLAGPIDNDEHLLSIVNIANEFNVRPTMILSLYLSHRNQIDAPDVEEEVIHNSSDASITLSTQTQ